MAPSIVHADRTAPRVCFLRGLRPSDGCVRLSRRKALYSRSTAAAVSDGSFMAKDRRKKALHTNGRPTFRFMLAFDIAPMMRRGGRGASLGEAKPSAEQERGEGSRRWWSGSCCRRAASLARARQGRREPSSVEWSSEMELEVDVCELGLAWTKASRYAKRDVFSAHVGECACARRARVRRQHQSSGSLWAIGRAKMGTSGTHFDSIT